MAFSYTVDAPPSAGNRRHNCQSVGPNLVLYSGTATMGGDATGTIDLTDTTKANLNKAATSILMFSIHNTENSAEDCQAKKNVTGAGAAAAGKIGILKVADVTNNTFEWEALVSI